jgi:hypothetical protein
MTTPRCTLIQDVEPSYPHSGVVPRQPEARKTDYHRTLQAYIELVRKKCMWLKQSILGACTQRMIDCHSCICIGGLKSLIDFSHQEALKVTIFVGP